MIQNTSQTSGDKTEHGWPKRLSAFRKTDKRRALFELAVTAGPLLLFASLALTLVAYGVWWGIVLVIPTAALLLRLFMIQHDCGHGAFFGQRRLDDWVGRAIGVLTLTPYECWRRTHAIHHASSGNLDARGIGDVKTLTVEEYKGLTSWGRLGYRFYRSPLVMFGLGPIWLFLIQQRLPMGLMRAGMRPWLSAMTTNAAIAAFIAGLIWMTGWLPFLLVYIPVILLAGAAGVWLFFVQHQFENTHWTGNEDWAFEHAALRGSSYYDLPAPLSWLTANIGIHHVHHVSSRVPYYRLPEVLQAYPELKQIGRVSFLDSVRGLKLVLWDESRRKLVSFRETAHAGLLPRHAQVHQ